MRRGVRDAEGPAVDVQAADRVGAAMRPAFLTPEDEDVAELGGEVAIAAMKPTSGTPEDRKGRELRSGRCRSRNEADVQDAGGRGVVGLIHPVEG